MKASSKPAVAKETVVQSSLGLDLVSTAEIPVSKRLVDQVIGQEASVEIIKKAAAQKRNVLLIGLPGTGKSMIAQAMAEILPIQQLQDILVYPNNADPNNPKVRTVRAGEGKRIVHSARLEALAEDDNLRMMGTLLTFAWFIFSYMTWRLGWVSDIIYAALLILGALLVIGFGLGSQMRPRQVRRTPKLLIDNAGKKIAPFAEATGARAGSLLGDVRHDPLQSGGLGTPAHLRVEPGLIHRANGGVLFLDEIATLSPRGQQELLTAMQEKKYSISGQSENSSGAMTRTDPVPCFPKGTIVETEEQSVAIEELVDSLFARGSEVGQFKKEGKTEFLELSSQLRVWVPTEKGIVLDRLERVYRRPYSGKLVRMVFDDGTELTATPEHPIKTPLGFVKAEQLVVGNVIESAACIITETDVIRTYDAENQRIALAYLEWKKNPSIGFSVLGVDHKTTAGWKKGAVPRAIQCTEWLQQKGLLPLKVTDSRLPLIARISGGLFGDGGLSRTGLYFTTDVESVEDLHSFKSDLLTIFGEETNQNFVFRQLTSKKGKGLELVMHNAFASRFLSALHVPQGDKVSQAFTVPQWVYFSPNFKKEFFSALLSCEMCGKITDATGKIAFVMAKVKQFEELHRAFLDEIRGFLAENNVATTEIREKRDYQKKTRNGPVQAALFSFDILNNHQNVRNLERAITIIYAGRKAFFMDKRFVGAKTYADYLGRLNENKAEAQTLRKNGFTIREIAKNAHLSVNTVMKVVGPTYNHYSKADREKASALVQTSGALKGLARQLDIPYTTLLYWKKRGFSNE